ncbi:threonine synthase [Clostridium tetanomorphum]|uniref:Threonine synthase n=1 Tax=Clostridium tetanomorphum TaxID=1553 RepID=A0A923E895_CLOTT|nr:threonine synthase [Clostridium tetanomorphum]KAJ48956.1 threonine synthase [Clostridium tetanomorphum DSM 665]KAJ50520.1 threonine synthase [Clostridium tetanomorphum DSM 665]MBC2398310.1 threonine synthase [Clostridium tetanomorphum]MBP1865572.1 threonine synthase [Clostridium tetanomorphum]NRS85922.1 threonine synthase [Clostridium tetanomorphum]
MIYKSTRGEKGITASQAIVKGIAEDGGLYVPIKFPQIDKPFSELINYDYKRLAVYILKKYFSDFTEEEIKYCVDNAYDNKFDSKFISPLVKVGEEFFLELYHGPTLAFKDMALSILPYLSKVACKKLNIKEEIIILTATSGDTGKAALEGFANVDGTKIMVFFPEEGVSAIQKRQMVTQEGENTCVIGINGNFDDAQRAVKEIFNDKAFNKLLKDKGYILSSANSINIGRLVPQIVYYVYSYLLLLKNEEIKEGETINITVPTGNFGNILAAFYAKKMGLPINKLICASNENNVLYDFFEGGIYNKNREFKVTSSPSMDILVSSNLERLLYYISNENEELINSIMKKLNSIGEYSINDDMKNTLNDFYSGFATDEETYKTIKDIFKKESYLIDTHTAVAYKVYKDYKNSTKDNRKTIIASTASPFKFTRDVCKALNIYDNKMDDFKLVYKLSSFADIDIPNSIKDIENREIIHNNLCNKEEIKSEVKKFLKV